MPQQAGTKNMTVGSCRKVITEFAAPLMLSQLFQQLYNAADSFIVGRFLGKEALAGAASSGTLIFLLVSFFSGAALGAGVVVARYFGSGDYDKVSRAIHTNIALGLVSGAALTIFGVAMCSTILRWLGTAESVMPQSTSYLSFYFAGVLANVMYNIFNGILDALGDARHPLYYLIFSSCLNIVLDLLFVGVFGWGVWSAAVATVISQLASALLCLRHLMQKGAVYEVRFRDVRFHSDMLRQIIKYGLPTGVQYSVIAFANVLVQANINSFGADAMAACGSYFKIESFVFVPITSFSMALTTFVGQNLGAREYERAREGARFGTFATVGLAELIGITMFLAAPVLIGLFSSDPDVIAIGVTQFRTETLFYCLLAYSHCTAGVCRGAGKAVVPMTVMLAVWCVFRIAYITVMMHFIHEIQYLFWAYPITWGISSVIFCIYFYRSNWQHGLDKMEG
jgi:putative MATE family efflux protein